jgi:hypothetical protein
MKEQRTRNNLKTKGTVADNRQNRRTSEADLKIYQFSHIQVVFFALRKANRTNSDTCTAPAISHPPKASIILKSINRVARVVGM